MIAVLHRHVPPHEAQIMVGALCGAGFHAHVLDFHAAHLYGALVFRGCRVVVDEEEVEEAQAFLLAPPEDEVPASNLPSELCSGDGGPPGFGVLLFGAFWLVVFASLSLALFLTVAYVPAAYMAVAVPLLFLGMVPPLLPPILRCRPPRWTAAAHPQRLPGRMVLLPGDR